MRVLKAFGATLVLLTVIAGLPWMLMHTIGDPLSAWPDLLAGDVNDQVVVSALAGVAWLAWAQFTVAVLVELVSGLRRSAVPRPLPGVFAFQQLSARALITAALMLAPAVTAVIAPTAMALASVAPSPVLTAAGSVRPVTESAAATPAAAVGAASTAAPTGETTTVTITRTGPHNWWDLAEQQLGSGQRWSELWRLNQGRPEPGGVRLTTPGPLKPGWTVLVPTAPGTPAMKPSGRAGTTTAQPTTAGQATSTPPPAPVTVVVRPGDSLARIATEHGTTWPQLWQANQRRDQGGGAVFTDPNVLQPGWTIVIPPPTAPADPGQVKVRPGDTLSGIAADHHVPLSSVWTTNRGRVEPYGARLADPDYLQPGWTLALPASEPAAASTAIRPPAPSPTISAQPTRDNTTTALAGAERAAAEQAAAGRAAARTASADAAARTKEQEKATAAKTAQQQAAAASAVPPRTSTVAATPAPVVPGVPGPTAAAGEGHATDSAATRTATTRVPGPTAAAGEQRDSAATLPAGVTPRVGELSRAGAVTASTSSSESSVSPVVMFGGGGLVLAGVCLSALLVARRRQFRWRRPGRVIRSTPPDLVPMERAVLTRGRHAAADVAWLDRALRSLSHQLATAAGTRVPDVVAARLGDDELELVLARPTRTAPAPWTIDESGLRWTLNRTADIGLTDDQRQRGLAPFPALVTVGRTGAGEHWLLDLEMIGSLSIAGDPMRGQNLARYVAAELAHNTWSESLRVTLVGFGAEMASANPERLSYSPDLRGAVDSLQVQIDAVHQVQAQAGVGVAQGRLRNIAGDTWAAHVLLVAPTSVGDVDALGEVLATLRSADVRLTVAVIVVDDTAPPASTSGSTRWALTIDDAGVLSVPGLDLTLHAEQLPAPEAQDLTRLLALAAGVDDEPAPPADSDRPWEKFADVLGGLQTQFTTDSGPPARPALRLAGTSPRRDGSVLAQPSHAYLSAAAVTEEAVESLAPGVHPGLRDRVEGADPGLDADLADWWDPASSTPKVTILGPVDVRAPGPLDPQRPRRAWNVEVVTYLATRGHGVTAEKLGADLWPDEINPHEKTKLRGAISTARRWLGKNPRTGQDHLPTNPGVPGSLYRVEDILLDAELFRRLRVRAAGRGPDGVPDLQSALDLVTGPPFDGARPGGYGWLADTALDHSCVAMIADVSHLVATHHLGAGNPERAMAAAQVALLAGSFADEPLLDCAASCYAQGQAAEGASYVKRIMANHDADVEEDLPPRTYEVLRRHGWLA